MPRETLEIRLVRQGPSPMPCSASQLRIGRPRIETLEPLLAFQEAFILAQPV